MKLTRRTTIAAIAGLMALGTAHSASAADLIAIITPSPDNPANGTYNDRSLHGFSSGAK
jgi:ABC-type sugar transport system substrate-binding protein